MVNSRLLLLLVLFLISVTLVSAVCINLTGGEFINVDTELCAGTHTLNDTITLNASGITINASGNATINGNGAVVSCVISNAVGSWTFGNPTDSNIWTTITGCTLGETGAFYVLTGSNSWTLQNTIITNWHNSQGRAIRFQDSGITGWTIDNIKMEDPVGRRGFEIARASFGILRSSVIRADDALMVPSSGGSCTGDNIYNNTYTCGDSLCGGGAFALGSGSTGNNFYNNTLNGPLRFYDMSGNPTDNDAFNNYVNSTSTLYVIGDGNIDKIHNIYFNNVTNSVGSLLDSDFNQTWNVYGNYFNVSQTWINCEAGMVCNIDNGSMGNYWVGFSDNETLCPDTDINGICDLPLNSTNMPTGKITGAGAGQDRYPLSCPPNLVTNTIVTDCFSTETYNVTLNTPASGNVSDNTTQLLSYYIGNSTSTQSWNTSANVTCDLNVNGSLNQSDVSGGNWSNPQEFNLTDLSVGDYNWSVNCSQDVNTGVSEVWNFTISAGDTCTPPGSGQWDLSCADNCSFNSMQIIPENVNITGSGFVNLSSGGVWNLTAANWWIRVYDSVCQILVYDGASIVG